jgi:nucleoside-diphosphate-sugar epimerase
MKETTHIVAVVGAGGFIGQHLCRALVEGGAEVYGFDLPPQADWSHERFHYQPLDVLAGSVELPKHCTALIYLAQSPYYREFPARVGNLFGVNAWGVARVAEAFLRTPGRLFLYASTGNVYAPSLGSLGETAPLRRDDAYALSKLAGEDIVRLLDTECDDRRFLSLRLFGVFGPGQRTMLPVTLFRRVARQEPILLQPSAQDPHDQGGMRISWLFVHDLVCLLSQMLRGDIVLDEVETALNLAGPRAVSIKEYASQIGRVLNKEPVWQLQSESRSSDLAADISLMQRLLHPEFTPLKKAIRLTVEDLCLMESGQDW